MDKKNNEEVNHKIESTNNEYEMYDERDYDYDQGL